MIFPFSRLLAAAAFIGLCGCQTSGEPVPDPATGLKIVAEGSYALPATTRFVVHSDVVGRDFVVIVSAPSGDYLGISDRPTPDETLPAIYALDDGWGIAGPIATMMQSVATMPRTYVISIGYLPGADDPNLDERSVDLLFNPTIDNGKTLGRGGAKFSAFLTDELRPWLEARYPLDKSKAILFGHSFGGLFAANVLAASPDAFAGYVIASPSVTRDAAVIDKVSAAAQKGVGRRVFVAAGEKETPDIVVGAKTIVTTLSSIGEFKVEMQVYAGEGHISYYPMLVPTAFRWMLQADDAPTTSKAIMLSAQELDLLTGDYVLPDGRVTTILSQDTKLFARITGLPGQSELSARSPKQFVIEGFNVVMVFEGPPDGPATDLVSIFNGVETRAKRK